MDGRPALLIGTCTDLTAILSVFCIPACSRSKDIIIKLACFDYSWIRGSVWKIMLFPKPVLAMSIEEGHVCRIEDVEWPQSACF